MFCFVYVTKEAKLISLLVIQFPYLKVYVVYKGTRKSKILPGFAGVLTIFGNFQKRTF